MNSFLMQEYTMVRDGLARLPDVFTVGDMSVHGSYYCSLPVYVLIVLSLLLTLCTLCTTDIINRA